MKVLTKPEIDHKMINKLNYGYFMKERKATSSIRDDIEDIVTSVRSRIIEPDRFDPKYEIQELASKTIPGLLASELGPRANAIIQIYSVIKQTREIINVEWPKGVAGPNPEILAVNAAYGEASGYGLCGEQTSAAIIACFKYARDTKRNIFPITKVVFENPKSKKQNKNHIFFKVRDEKGEPLVFDVLLNFSCRESEYWKHPKLCAYVHEIDITDPSLIKNQVKITSIVDYTQELVTKTGDLLEQQVAALVDAAKPRVKKIVWQAEEAVLSFLFTSTRVPAIAQARNPENECASADDQREKQASLR
jgi:hypothetical protein